MSAAPDTQPSSPPRDWTTGPAKWFAVVLLAAASIAGVYWSLTFRATRPDLAPLPPADTPAPTAGNPAPAAPAPLAATLDINTATAAQLQLLPGIGPALAARIVEDRAQHGRYTSIDQLDRVRGIGPKTIEKLRPLVRVE